MASGQSNSGEMQAIEKIVGYLNFSSGASDDGFLRSLNEWAQRRPCSSGTWWREWLDGVREALPVLRGRSETYSDLGQVTAVLELLEEDLLPGYLDFHRDLLFHQDEDFLFGPFFIGRACECLLHQGGAWNERSRVTKGALLELNDFIGFRPVPTLERHRHQPYSHEWIRPVPLYISGAGVAYGKFERMTRRALEILESTGDDILHAAQFDFDLLDELAVDPRAYDFDHPVHKRPNYQFGQWDPHKIDQSGYYRRFVVLQMTLEALLARVEEESDGTREEREYEASAVLAGTVLMASGVSGNGPSAHDSDTTLSTLLPIIAGYRDTFYERLIEHAEPSHRARLLEESKRVRQPFGKARQHLNAWLARCRARQMEHIRLAKIFARMGHAEAAARQSGIIPVASARMSSQIDCRLTLGDHRVDEGKLDDALQRAEEIMDLLHRGIECGAIIDPWNILGFDAQFSLFHALENSVHDLRADELVAMMEQYFSFLSRIWSAAAAGDHESLCEEVRRQFEQAVDWWRQFAAHEVSNVDAVDPLEVFRAAEHVAESLKLWHRAGAAAGDVRFWAPHAHMFDSPKAFALVVNALLERDDFVASMALMIHWLSVTDHVALQRGDSSFNQLAQRWLLSLLRIAADPQATTSTGQAPCRLVRKFFDFLEANAGDYWHAPKFRLRSQTDADVTPVSTELDDDEAELFSAAYENVIYNDSTDDGVDGSIFDFGDSTNDEFAEESNRVADRLMFLSSLTQLWKLTAVHLDACVSDNEDEPLPDCLETMTQWVRSAASNHQILLELVEDVRRHRIVVEGTDPESQVRYDRQRVAKEGLLERIIHTCVDVSAVGQTMLAALLSNDPAGVPDGDELAEQFGEEARLMVAVLSAVMADDREMLGEVWPDLMEGLADKPLLYVPLAKEGTVEQLIAARCRQQQLKDLLAWLPRRGLWQETCELLEMARQMERNNPVGPGAVTEFDELFKAGYRGLVESLVASSETWLDEESVDDQVNALAANLEELTEVLLGSWLSHSRTLRLSVLERITSADEWNRLVAFIKQYGSDLFTQRFFSLGNIRAILHQGVGAWLDRVCEEDDSEQWKLFRELESEVSREEAEDHLSLILEAVVENYGEYRDYNSTTTQSDHGELLYMFLDFLRLRTEYDRVCWHLKPVILAHEILVRRGKSRAAKMWKRALTERIDGEADRYLTRLTELQQKYAIRMSTVADRLAERFVRPMIIDQIRSLVKPAIMEARQDGATTAFDLLEHETEALASVSTGIGFDVPVWLLALEEEVDRVRRPADRSNVQQSFAYAVPLRPLSQEEIRDQLDAATGV